MSSSSTSVVVMDDMKDLKQTILFFGNDFPAETNTVFRSLYRSSKDQRCSRLAYFLSLSNDAIREEVALLPRSWQKHVPPVTDFLALVNNTAFRKGPLGGAMEGVFLAVFQIGSVIAHHEVEGKLYEFDKPGTTLAGLGCGLLAASAVAVSPTLADLAVAGAQSIRIAFRLGIHVYEISSLLEAPLADPESESWAYVVPGLSADVVQAEIDNYNQRTSNTGLTSVFISASDKTSVSISGPPSRLRVCLKGSDVLRYSNFFALPVHHGLCHAPHIYSQADVDMIIGHIQLVNGESPRVLLPLLSSETGNTFTCRNFEELSAEVVDQLLTRKIHVDNITRGLLETLPPAPSTCVLWSFKKSLILSAIIQKIEISPDSPQIELKDLVKWVNQEFSTTIPRSPKQAKLAIVGMSCRLPGGANDLELYWQLMAEGRNACSTVPPDRFDLSTHYDPTRKIENTTPTPFMNFMENPGFFDAGFFNMSPREALETDPMHRLALVTAYEALEMAGYSPDRTRSTNRTRIGTYYGQASDDYRELNGSQNIGTYAVPGGERGFANGRIQYFFKFSGPSFNIDAACSSSLAAVNAACSALWAGEADTVLAGGLNVITDPDNFCQLGNGHFLSTTGQCKVWDEAADGYCRADGVGCVVIKRLEDAEADNDNILGVILSAATNHNSDAASITQPHAPTQMLNYENVMFSAGVDPLNVSYVELHGTGTQVGDREESRSVAEVFAPLTPQKRRKSQKLLVGAVKSNIGHGEAAAGIASLIKVLLMYQNGLIPAHIGMKKMNPLIPQDLAERNMGLNLELSEWPKPAKGSRYAVVNNFGAHGGNTTLLLEDAPGKQLIGHDPRTSYPITISARSRISLKMNIEALIEYLDEHEDVNLGDLSYTLCARRIHHPFRVSSCVNSISDLRKFLVRQVEAAPSTEAVPLKSPGIAFVFTGQGSFYNGIGSDLYHHYPTFTAEVNRLNRLVESLGFPSVVPYIKGSDTAGVSPIISQLSIVVIQIALIRFWSSLGVQPVAVLGHSLGEFAAFVATGTLSEVDSIFLAGCRAAMVTKSCEQGKHKMLAVRASLTELQSLLSEADDTYEVSCINTENDTVISGPTETIENINLDLKSKGLKCLLLDVPFAFHSKQMDPILEPFERLAENATFKAPNIPVISPLLAECIFDGKTLNASYLKRATREVVDFVGALDAAQELGIVEADTIWMELGPHFVTGHFVKNILSSERVLPSLQRDVNNFNTIGSSLAWLHNNGVDVSWNEYYRPYETAHNLLTLKSYKWNEKNYWIPYLGTWTLDKALLKYNLQKDSSKNTDISLSFRLKTSLVHGILSETIGDSTASISTLSNMIDPAFLEAMEGHVMNGHGVATQSIWADMAFTVGKYLHDQVKPKSKEFVMSVNNMIILEGQVANPSRGSKQLLQLEAQLDLTTRAMPVQLYNASDDGVRAAEPFGSCVVTFEDGAVWQEEWRRLQHLVVGQIRSLETLASQGKANRLTKNMAYTLFKNVVDYADRYRGMQSVIISDYEASAEITLSNDEAGIWHTPPHWIDSVAHLAGLIVNGSDASNTADYFYVTSGWESMRFGKPLVAGASYRNYVKMIPSTEKGVWTGDVYILQGETIVGVVGQIKFRQFPRLLMDRFFSPNKGGHAPTETKPTASVVEPARDIQPVPVPKKDVPSVPAAPIAPAAKPVPPHTPAPAPVAEPKVEENALVANIMDLIAAETGIDRSELIDSTQLASIGVDSLMALVLVEKFKAQLQLDINSSLFLECSTIGEFKEWIEENR